MAQTADSLAESLVLPKQDKISFVQLFFLSAQPPQVKDPSVAEGCEERENNKKAAEAVEQTTAEYLW